MLKRTYGNTKTVIATLSGSAQGTLNVVNNGIEFFAKETVIGAKAKEDSNTLISAIRADETTKYVDEKVFNTLKEFDLDDIFGESAKDPVKK
jgi:hypothetical protein